MEEVEGKTIHPILNLLFSEMKTVIGNLKNNKQYSFAIPKDIKDKFESILKHIEFLENDYSFENMNELWTSFPQGDVELKKTVDFTNITMSEK